MILALQNDQPQEKRFTDRVRPQHLHALKSLAERLEESSVVLTDLTRLLKRAATFVVKTPKVALDVPDVELEVLLDDVGEVPSCLRVTRNEGSRWRQTGRRIRNSSKNQQQEYSLRRSCAPQPEGTQTPINLE